MEKLGGLHPSLVGQLTLGDQQEMGKGKPLGKQANSLPKNANLARMTSLGRWSRHLIFGQNWVT